MLLVFRTVLTILMFTRCASVSGTELALEQSLPCGYRGLGRMRAELKELCQMFNSSGPGSEWGRRFRFLQQPTAGHPDESSGSVRERRFHREPSAPRGHRTPIKEGLEDAMRILIVLEDLNHQREPSLQAGLKASLRTLQAIRLTHQDEPPLKAGLKEMLITLRSNPGHQAPIKARLKNALTRMLRSRVEDLDLELAEILVPQAPVEYYTPYGESKLQEDRARRDARGRWIPEAASDAQLHLASHTDLATTSDEKTTAMCLLHIGIAAGMTFSLILFCVALLLGKSNHYF
ncbi:hypothetical protein PtB15_10B298 [Puccinia triticina]|nr:hypothetical protein PtB15_10B298 [Puccinia triticina]